MIRDNPTQLSRSAAQDAHTERHWMLPSGNMSARPDLSTVDESLAGAAPVLNNKVI